MMPDQRSKLGVMPDGVHEQMDQNRTAAGAKRACAASGKFQNFFPLRRRPLWQAMQKFHGAVMGGKDLVYGAVRDCAVIRLKNVAQALGISRATLYRRIAKFGIVAPHRR